MDTTESVTNAYYSFDNPITLPVTESPTTPPNPSNMMFLTRIFLFCSIGFLLILLVCVTFRLYARVFEIWIDDDDTDEETYITTEIEEGTVVFTVETNLEELSAEAFLDPETDEDSNLFAQENIRKKNK